MRSGIVLLVALLAGCASFEMSRHVLYGPAGADYQRDLAQCQYEAKASTRPSRGIGDLEPYERRRDLEMACLRARGYGPTFSVGRSVHEYQFVH